MAYADMDDIYIEAYEQLLEELDREPTDEEVSELAQKLFENASADAYDHYKAMRYDD